jgi:hypothetical protein
MMEFEEGSSSQRASKRTFLEALREYSQQTVPNAKRATVDANATDIIRVEINKVLNLTFLRHPRGVL